MKQKRIWLGWTLTCGCWLAGGSGLHAQDTADQGGAVSIAAPGATATGAGRGPRIFEVDLAHLRALEGLDVRNDVDAVSLSVPRARLRTSAKALQSLTRWVHDGGVVFLHTDAAQLFGYSTVAARRTTNRVAGQMFGRARAALPFGAHPLLWGAVGGRGGAGGPAAGGGGDGAQNGGGRSIRVPAALGVRTVFYQLSEGDDLVVGHPAGVPLLRVTDLAVPARAPLLAAAIAPYGRGWAVFTPALVEQHRGDGAVFLRNLTRLIASSVKALGRAGATAGTATRPGGADAGTMLTSFPAPLLEDAASALSQARTTAVDYGALAQRFAAALHPPADDVVPAADAAGAPAVDAGGAPVAAAAAPVVTDDNGIAVPAGTGVTPIAAPPTGAAVPAAARRAPATAAAGAAANQLLEPRLMLAQEEADRVVRLLNGSKTNTAWRPYATALVYMLRARLELQRGDVRQATAWFQHADDLRADTAESLLWRGTIAAASAEDITASSQQRAGLWGTAASFWRDALTADPLVRKTNATTAGAANGGDAGGDASGGALPGNISGVPRELVRAWGMAAAYSASVMNGEPPLVRLLGTPDSGMVLRFFGDDPTIRLAIPAGDLAARSTGALGWHADQEELLIFPTPEYYVAYRRGAGLGTQSVPNPAGAFGDIVGNRIMMVSQASIPVVLPPATPGGPRRFVQMGTSVVPVVARMHAYVLMNALAGGGTEVPGWMQLGLAGLTNIRLAADLGGGTAGAESVVNLRRYAAVGALLSPDQFRNAPQNGDANGDTVGLPEDQGMSLMDFFYARFGAGNVVETLQRLGSGESVDEALNATTGMNEQQFFRAWYNAYFG